VYKQQLNIMKKVLMAAMSLLMFAVVVGFVSVAINAMLGVPEWVTSIVAVVVAMVRAYVSMRAFDANYSNERYAGIGGSRSDVQVEIWAKYIMGAIFKNNEFLNYAFNADDYVMQGKVVHIPQAGAPAAVQKNRSSLPATVTKRTDTDVTYPLDEFTTDPRLIPHADKAELSYDKMNSVMADDMDALRQVVADNMLISWAPAANFVRTTGDEVDATVSGASGTRKKFKSKDLLAAQTFLNKQDIPANDRYALLPATMYADLIEDLSEGAYRDFSRAMDPEKGVVGMLYGFKVMMRSSVLVYTNAATPVVKAYGAEAAATDNEAALCWQVNALERAKGEVVVFDQANSPQYYGDLMSFLMRMGGRVRRSDEKGVVAIVQAHGAA
jgi:hypothetical protein